MKEIRRRLTAIFFSLVMVLSVISPGGLAKVEAADSEYYVYLTVERSTLGMGLIVEPVKISYNEDDNFKEWLIKTLQPSLIGADSNGLSTQWNTDEPEELIGVYAGARPSDWSANAIPTKIYDKYKELIGTNTTTVVATASGVSASSWLYEWDYRPKGYDTVESVVTLSRWIVSFDDVQMDEWDYPGYTLTSEDNGKVVRVQYSLYDGEDIVGTTNTFAPNVSKLELIKAIADYVKAGSSTSSQNYTDAISVLENWDATQTEVDNAKDNLLGTEHTHTAGTTWSSDATNHWNTCTAGDGETMNSAAHKFSETTTAATCTSAGSKTYTCSVCGYTKTETIAATAHKLTKVAKVEATCTQAGNVEYYKCSVCGNMFSDENATKKLSSDDVIISATGHQWNDTYTVDTSATCVKSGTQSIHCKVCSATKNSETIPATGHSYGEWEITTAPTCTEKGVKTKECTTCHTKQTEDVSALGHSPVKVEAKEATCTDAGNIEYYKCSRCNEKFSDQNATITISDDDVVVSAGHVPASDYTVDKAASCTEEGSQSIHCTRCKESIAGTTQTISKTQHSYGAWVVTKSATATEDGIETKTCTVCGATETQTIFATKSEHTHTMKLVEAKAATCTADGNEAYYVCETCNHKYLDNDGTQEITADEDYIIPAGHNWSNVVSIDKEATCTEDGSQSYHCTNDNCQAKKDETTISATGHQFTTWNVVTEATCTTAGSRESVCDKCENKCTENILALGHDLSVVDEKPATCTVEGKAAYYICSRCNNKYSDANATQLVTDAELVLPVIPHTFGDWGDVENESGKKKRTCQICNYEETETISGHTTHEADASGWNSDANNHWQVCSFCEEEFDKASHTYGDWQTVKAATEQAEGLEKRVCSACNYEETRTTKKLEASSKDSTSSEKKNSSDNTTESQPAAVGTTLSDTGKVTYKVNGNQTVEYTANKTATGSVKIPATVEKNGVTYKVTTVAASAFKNNKKITSVNLGSNITSVGKDAFSGCTKLKSVTIGKNITTIGKNAFKGCKKLKTITINSTKLKKSKVGSNAFKSISSKATIKVPKSKYKEYKKWFKSKGLSSKVKIKKK